MTLEEYREYGYVSRLSEIKASGGPSSSQISTQNALTQQQLSLAQTQEQQSQKQYEQAQTLEQPAIQKYTALATGSPTAATAAAAPEIGTIAKGYDAAKAQIMNTLPPGAARDKALADLETQKYTGTAGVLAAEVQQAPDILANIGAGMGAFSLQEVGAALSGFSGASQSNTQEMQAQNQAKANQVGLISGLAQAAGGAISPIKIPSDRRLKNSIVDVHAVLHRGLRMPVVRFYYNDGYEEQIGFIAQDVQKEFPQAVSRRPDGMLVLDYGAIAAVAIGMVQELAGKVKDLERKLESAAVAGVR